jgi:hypothetical protein
MLIRGELNALQRRTNPSRFLKLCAAGPVMPAWLDIERHLEGKYAFFWGAVRYLCLWESYSAEYCGIKILRIRV